MFIVYESDHFVKAAICIRKDRIPCWECTGARGFVACREHGEEEAGGSSKAVIGAAL